MRSGRRAPGGGSSEAAGMCSCDRPELMASLGTWHHRRGYTAARLQAHRQRHAACGSAADGVCTALLCSSHTWSLHRKKKRAAALVAAACISLAVAPALRLASSGGGLRRHSGRSASLVCVARGSAQPRRRLWILACVIVDGLVRAALGSPPQGPTKELVCRWCVSWSIVQGLEGVCLLASDCCAARLAGCAGAAGPRVRRPPRRRPTPRWAPRRPPRAQERWPARRRGAHPWPRAPRGRAHAPAA